MNSRILNLIVLFSLLLLIFSGCKKSEIIYLNNYGLGMMIKDIKGIKKITIEDIEGLSNTKDLKIFVNTVEVYDSSQWKLLKTNTSIETKDGENYFWFKIVDNNSQLVRQKRFKIKYNVENLPPKELVEDVTLE